MTLQQPYCQPQLVLFVQRNCDTPLNIRCFFNSQTVNLSVSDQISVQKAAHLTQLFTAKLSHFATAPICPPFLRLHIRHALLFHKVLALSISFTFRLHNLSGGVRIEILVQIRLHKDLKAYFTTYGYFSITAIPRYNRAFFPRHWRFQMKLRTLTPA
jgi:hypothetical protein